MEARRLSVVRDDDGFGGDEDECLSVALWIFGLQVGPAQALAYAYLYGQTHGKGLHTFTCSLGDLINTFDRDRRTIEGWLAALEAQPAALIRVHADPLTGQLRIIVYRPTSFAPRRTTRKGRDPQKRLPGVEDGPSGLEKGGDVGAECSAGVRPVAPVAESKGLVGPTDDLGVAAIGARMAPTQHAGQDGVGAIAQSGEGSGVCAQNPPNASGVFAQDPPQKPPDAILAIQQSLERRRSQAFRARLGGAQKPPAHELLKISVSVSEETRNRDLRSAAGDFAQKPPSGEAADGAAPPHGAESSYGAGLPLHSLARLIHRDVGPSLQRGVALKVAQAVLAGFIDGADVERAIIRAHDLVADGRCKAPFVYFVGAMQIKFAERGAEWQARRGGRR